MLQLIDHPDDIREIRLARAPVNALDPALIRAIRLAVESAPADGVAGLVLSGAPGMFSAGLDVPALLALDRGALMPVWTDFFGIFAAIACSPVPVVAAITGHSPAGGAVMAIHCDYRIMAAGDFRIGLNEVQVGLVVPECLQLALRRLTGPRHAEQLMVAGAMIPAQRAFEIGMVDELAGPDAVVPRAIDWLRHRLALPRQAMLATRAIARAELVAAYADPAAMPLADVQARWWSDETQATLHKLVAKLKAR
ncbi:enoyl-CoA hydratase/isomerase family protein [Jeongeupia chitinilytica]|uniref:Enoyl-CoA hydratase/isomerase family protein n=1 Tax=Jeongeupia chitinilytica TaxID=1041641 RepID=A0ABQ3H074_9NEIS|nr:enoyl-CoA hydratase/isomerase family protein [Jeongeupia chitinilytica]GHD62303.1 hypothetical protein GCM10007350_18050 [Jeongeupia chitinilytica]